MNKSLQQQAIEKLSKLKVGAIFSEMGTGKTKIALDLICAKRHKVDYILWICPFSVKNEIENERLKWHPDLEMEICGFESIGSSGRIYLELLNKVKSSRAFIVLDETLKVKNKKAKRTKRILEMGKYATYKLILNGTPISKNLLDLWTQMEFLSPKILNMSYSQFKNTYCVYYVRGPLKDRVKKHVNVEHLVEKIKHYIFDARLDIEARKSFIDYKYEMSESELEAYEQFKVDFLDKYIDDELDDIGFFALTTGLQKIYTSCINRQKLFQQIESEFNEKTIVFVKFLNNIPSNSLKIIGEMNLEQRKNAIEEFKHGNKKFLYITYGCGSFGLNLQFCRNMIFADQTFDYSQKIQAEARIYRMGQESNVTYYNLWCDIGLEHLIQGCLDKKTNLLDEIKKEIAKVGIEQWVKTI